MVISNNLGMGRGRRPARAALVNAAGQIQVAVAKIRGKLLRAIMTNNLSSIPAQPRAENAAWKAIVAEYQKPSLGRALWQITNTVVPYGALWYLMYLCLPVSWWLVVPLAILAGGFLVRVFIIFHDCGHGSYFKSSKANDLAGFLSGILTFTPYYHWRWEHAIHHSSAGDLDKRGTGDVWTMTVQEYLESSRWNESRRDFLVSG